MELHRKLGIGALFVVIAAAWLPVGLQGFAYVLSGALLVGGWMNLLGEDQKR